MFDSDELQKAANVAILDWGCFVDSKKDSQ